MTHTDHQLPRMSRTWAMPCSNTFECRPIREFVERWVKGVSVDPFARNSKIATWRNDLNPQTDAITHVDAEEFLLDLSTKGIVANCVILDPPYSPRQISECYKAAGRSVGMADTQNAALYARVRKAARLLCRIDSIVLSFGDYVLD